MTINLSHNIILPPSAQISQLLLNRNYVCRVAPINCNFLGRASPINDQPINQQLSCRRVPPLLKTHPSGKCTKQICNQTFNFFKKVFSVFIFLIQSTKRSAIFWHLKTGTRNIRNFRQSMLKDPQNGRAQNSSNTFTFWFESLYKSLKVSYHSFHKVNMSHGRNTRKIPDQVFQYPIIPDWLFT